MATFNRTDLLRVPGVHVVYTVPPWLKVKAPHVIQGYDNALLLPCLKVRDQVSRAPFRPGLDALAEVVAQRFDWEKVLSRAQLDQVALASGGQFRMVALLRMAHMKGALNARQRSHRHRPNQPTVRGCRRAVSYQHSAFSKMVFSGHSESSLHPDSVSAASVVAFSVSNFVPRS